MIRILVKKALTFVRRGGRTRVSNTNMIFSNSLVDTLVPDHVEIGQNFVSAPGSVILGHDASLILFYEKYRIEKTIIGNNVFLGANSVVLPGVIIEDNVIVGAGAVVTKKLESNGVYAGNPAKYICSIEDYYMKCNDKDVLFDMTSQMKKSFQEGQKFDKSILEEFRESISK